ncbi:MAG: hypothetical protein WEE89_15435 [Gemmatimonadota bacterium]
MSRNDDLLPDGERVSEQNARKVLERAIQIDTDRAGDTTVGELRKVADELNISPTALMQALREVQAPAPEPRGRDVSVKAKPAWINRALGWTRTALIGWAGLLGGTAVEPNLAIGLSPSGFGLAIGMLVSASVALTLYDQRTKPKKSSLIDVLVLFISFFIGWGRSESNPVYANDGRMWFLLIAGLISLGATVLLQRIDWPWSRKEQEPKQEFTATA